ncbi:MAG: GAF domain-containing protein [Nitriliruptorales bacterium]|nr:GAF domain-containing protein [Nitriliruptorales bacterium]
MIDYAGIGRVLHRLAGTLVQQYDLSDVLDHLGTEITQILAVNGAGVMLEDEHQHLRLTSTSDRVLQRLEDLQIELQEGPCLLAYQTGEHVIVADIGADERFPRFGSLARDAGMAAVYSFPLRLQDKVVGALNLYRDTPGQFDPEQIEVGQTLADVATAYLVHAEDVQRSAVLNRQLQHALDSRVVIEQAKGFVAARLDTRPDLAFEALRRYARQHGVKLRSVSQDVLERRLSVEAIPFQEVTQHPAGGGGTGHQGP